MPIVTWSRPVDPPISPTALTSWTMDGVPQLPAEPHALGPLTGLQSTTSFRGSQDEDYERMSGEELRRDVKGAAKAQYDNGHNFSTSRTWAEVGFPSVTISCPRFLGGGPKCVYNGPWGPYMSAGFPSTTYVPEGTTSFDGRQLISMTIPTAPEAGLATFLGELREALPQAIGIQTLKAQSRQPGGKILSLGDEHLNYQFGLKPFANDLAKLAYSVTQASALIRKMKKDSGGVLHRRATLQDTTTTSILPSESSMVYLPRMASNDMENYAYGSAFGGSTTITETTVTKVWFSGAFSYFLADSHDLISKLEGYEQLANQLLGTRITPETVWELTPWSWLLDWKADLGTFFRNVSLLSGDSTVLRYGYVMHNIVRRRQKTVVGINARTGASVPSVCWVAKNSETKQRTAATPYGFGLNPDSFSGSKWAILSALGMSKGNNKLRGT